MCTPSETEKLIATVMKIDSPLKNFGNLVPKAVYLNEFDDTFNANGIFYDPNTDKLVYADFYHGKLVDLYEGVPTHIELPDENGEYDYDEDEMMDLHDCNFCGEADDLSCYIYFSAVNTDED